MGDQFIPYELEVKLKKLGCDKEFSNGKHVGILWQQAFDFLLKKYNLYGVIIPTVTMYWTFKTMTVVEGIVEVPPYKHVDANDYETYQKARQACLEKLIELCQQ